MPSIAVTGTIGSGKSLVTRLIAGHLAGHTDFTLFSADQENTRLLESDPEVRNEILNLLGADSYDGEGRPVREVIRSRILGDASLRTGLERILHPRIRAAWESRATVSRGSLTQTFLAEIPLLFERDLADRFERVVVVACSESVRMKRLSTQRGLSREEAVALSRFQMPQEQKILLADHVVWNDGDEASLGAQAGLLASLLQS